MKLTAADYYERALNKSHEGDDKGAIADFNKAIKLDANNALAYSGRGMARPQKEIGGAIDDFNKAIELDPKSSEAYFGRGTAYLEAGDAEKAKDDLTLAVKLDVSLQSLADPLLERCQTPKRDVVAFQSWAKSYRTAARLDGYRAAKSIIDFEFGSGLTLKVAQETVRKNIELVAISMSYAQLNKAVDFAPVIAKQIYNAEASPCRYIIFFFDREGDISWLLVDNLKEIDLADILNSGQFTGPAMWQIRIRHPGEKPFSQGEHARLEKAVMNDLRYDFSETELSIEFERHPFGLSVLLE